MTVWLLSIGQGVTDEHWVRGSSYQSSVLGRWKPICLP